MGKSVIWAVLAVFVMTPLAFGAIDAGDDIYLDLWQARPTVVSPPQSQGPFYAKITEGATTEFEGLLFCVEKNEYFSPPHWYTIESMTNASNLTGRYLSGYAAWVYEQFQGFLNSPTVGPAESDSDHDGYDDGLETNHAAWVAAGINSWGEVMNLYQSAVWAGMVDQADFLASYNGTTYDEIKACIGNANAECVLSNNEKTQLHALGIGIDDFFGDAAWGELPGATDNQQLAWLDDVWVLNIVDGHIQDMVGEIPGEYHGIVPEPASLLVWSLLGLGSAGMAVWSRRRRDGLTGGGRPRWNRENREAILALIERGRKA